tara:strand:+ start:198 stop:932 length:735 start_codon:yes stop_codon:yes gene_type:complete
MNPENKAQIQSNRRKIFELEILINSNKTKVEVCRASIEQNYASIMRNYNAAYMGNHHLANQETDEILRNRLAIMSNMIAEQDVEVNFRESMNNKAQLDFLEHKSSVNKTILDVNKQLTEINKKLIELNRMIMKKNEQTLQFNTENLATNEKFLKGEFHPSKATEKDNKKRIEQNKKRCSKIEELASQNKKSIIEVQSKTQTNAIDIMKNSVQISERRERINDLQEKVNENQNSVAEMISIKIKN